MPASRIAPRVTAWRAANRNLPGMPTGGIPAGGVPFLDDFVPGYTFGARIYPGADTTAAPSTWTPVDISAHILQPGDGSPPAITITRARLGEQQETAPAQCTLTLRNDPAKGNGNYTPRRATSIYYPYMAAGLPMDVFIATSLTTFVRFAGKVEQLLPQWDETGNAAFVVVTAYGVWQEIQTGATPLRSPMYRMASAATTNQVAYWPLEDGPDATSAASEVVGVRAMRVGGSVAFGTPGVGGTAAMVDLNGGGTLYGALSGGTATNHWGVLVGFEVQDTTSSKSAYPLYWTTSSGIGATILFSFQGASVGTAFQLTLGGSAVPGGGGSVLNTVYTAMGGDLTTWQPGTFHTILIYTITTGVGVINMGAVIDGLDSAGLFPTGIIADITASPGALRQIHVNPDAADFSYLSIVDSPSLVSQAQAVAHVKAWAPFTQGSTVTVGAANSGYAGETPSARLTRICGEQNIPFALPAGSSNPARTMGPQTVDTLYNVLRECETVEGGVLEDGINFGLALWTVESRYNQTAAFTPALQQLQPPLPPVENTLRVRNDVTASQPTGSSARYQQPAGQPYAVSGPGGIGSRPFPATVNVHDPDQLINYAAWLVHLGTINADRYAGLAVNLAARTGLINPWLAVTNGDRWTTPTTYPTGGTAPDVLVEGWTETLSRKVYGIAANSSPADPWTVGVLDSTSLGKLDTAGCVLAAAWDGSSGSFQVTTTSGPLWTTTGGEYPFDLDLAGQRVTVSACAGGSNPQTFTVSVASVNGVTKSHPAGEAVSLWQPLVLAL